MRVDETTIYESPDPRSLYCYSPSLIATKKALYVSFDIGGPGVAIFRKHLAQSATTSRRGVTLVLKSKNGGRSWRQIAELDMWHARLFESGGAVYAIGHAGDLCISMLRGKSGFTDPIPLTTGQTWHGCGSNVIVKDGRIYVPFEQRVNRDIAGWNLAGMALGVLIASEDSDLCDKRSWQYVSAPVNHELAQSYEGTWARFWNANETQPLEVLDSREAPAFGFLEAQLVDARGRAPLIDSAPDTLFIISRAHTGATGLAGLALLKGTNGAAPAIELPRTPSGRPFSLIPFPGGQLKTSIVYDEVTELFWMAANLPWSSLTHPGANFVGLPNNERHWLVLYFSHNALEWIPAQRLCGAHAFNRSAHYPSLLPHGKDLLVAIRRGSDKAQDNQYSDRIALLCVRDFRRLAAVA